MSLRGHRNSLSSVGVFASPCFATYEINIKIMFCDWKQRTVTKSKSPNMLYVFFTGVLWYVKLYSSVVTKRKI